MAVPPEPALQTPTVDAKRAPHRQEDRRFAAAAAAIVAFFFVLGLINLGDRSLWQDEGWDIHLVTRPWQEMWRLLDIGSVHPPLYHLILRLWVQVFGDSVFAARLPSLLFSVGTLLTVLYGGRALFGPRAALMAGLGLALSSRFLICTQEIRIHPLNAFIYTLAATLAALSIKTCRRDVTAAAGVASLLALWTDVWGVVLMAGVDLAILLQAGDLRRRAFPWRIFLAGQAACAATLGAAAWYVMHRPHGVKEMMFDLPYSALSYLNTFFGLAVGSALEPSALLGPFAISCVLALALPVGFGIWVLLRRSGAIGGTVVLLTFLPWLATVAIHVLLHSNVVTDRRMSFTLPLIWLIAGVGFAHATRVAAVLVAAYLLYANMLSSWHWLTDNRYHFDWRDAVGWVSRRIGPDDAIVLQNSYNIYVFNYYFRGQAPIYLLGPGNEGDFEALARKHPRLWFVTCQGYQVDPQFVVVSWLQAHERVGEQMMFDNIPQPDGQIIVVEFIRP